MYYYYYYYYYFTNFFVKYRFCLRNICQVQLKVHTVAMFVIAQLQF